MTPSAIYSGVVDPQRNASYPESEQDLRPSEVVFVNVMQELAFGLVERLQIVSGEVVLNPEPAIVRHIKFGTPTTNGKTSGGTSDLRQQIAEFFAYVRQVDTGEIRCLEVRHGLPFSMEVELAGGKTDISVGGRHG